MDMVVDVERGNMPDIDDTLLSPIRRAKQDLADRLGVAESAIEVTRAERVVWPDGSLGCPRPGMLYSQALVPGVFIQLKAAGHVYNYHGGRSGTCLLCDSPNEVLPEDIPEDIRFRGPI